MLSLSSERPNAISLAIILPFCAKTENFLSGKLIHSYAVKTGLESETLVGNSLVSMYAKSGIVPTKIFHQIVSKDVISYNSMISGFLEFGLPLKGFELLREMAFSGVGKPNDATFVILLPVCNSKLLGKEIHGYIVKFKIMEITSVSNALMAFYCRIGEFIAAEQVFLRVSLPDIVSWNTMIAGSVINGYYYKALKLFRELENPDKISFVSILPVFAEVGKVSEGKMIHALSLVSPDLERETTVKNALISFYLRIGQLKDAIFVFSEIKNKDLVSWNSILAGLSSKEELLATVKNMQLAGFRPDAITILSLLHWGFTRELHGFSVRAGFMGRDDVTNSLADSYSRLGFVENALRLCKTFGLTPFGKRIMISIFMRHGMICDAEQIFEEVNDKDDDAIIMMIHGYARNGLPHCAITTFVEFSLGQMPNGAAIVSVLPACARLASMQMVRQCHAFSLRTNLLSESHLAATLIDSYCKCGSVNFAQKIFSMIGSESKDLVCYTAMTAGYAMSGMTAEALTLFHEMAARGIEPDHVTMTTVLSACSHGRRLKQGIDFFLKPSNMDPTEEQYGCIVDLFARVGMLTEAINFARATPEKVNRSAWGALLGGCKVNGDVAVGKMAAEQLFYLESENVGNYVVMSNIYAAAGNWEEVEKVRGLVKDREMKKPPGCSWIEVGKSMHVFVAGDLSHPERTCVYRALKILNMQIKHREGSEETALKFS